MAQIGWGVSEKLLEKIKQQIRQLTKIASTK